VSALASNPAVTTHRGAAVIVFVVVALQIAVSSDLVELGLLFEELLILALVVHRVLLAF